MLIAGLSCAQHLTNALIKLGQGQRPPFVATSAIGVVTLGLLFTATLSVRPPLNNSGLVRNGAADDYREFQQFLRGVEANYDLILLSDRRNRATRSLPIYLLSWNGVERVWSGEVVLAEAKQLDEMAGRPGEKLFVVDLTKSRRPAEVKQADPIELLGCLDANGEPVFRSSSGFVIGYLIRGPRKLRCV